MPVIFKSDGHIYETLNEDLENFWQNLINVAKEKSTLMNLEKKEREK